MVPEVRSKESFFCFNGQNIKVLADESTVIGVSEEDDQRVVLVENLGGFPSEPDGPKMFCKNTGRVTVVLVFEDLGLMLAADEEGGAVQYDLLTGRLQVDYGNLGLGFTAGSRIGQIGVLVGSGDLRVFLVSEQRVLEGGLGLHLEKVISLGLVQVRDAEGSRKFGVVMSGALGSPEKPSPDSLDLTELLNSQEAPDDKLSIILSKKRNINDLAEELRIKAEEQFELKRHLAIQNSILISKLEPGLQGEALGDEQKELREVNQHLRLKIEELGRDLQIKDEMVRTLKHQLLQMDARVVEMQKHYVEKMVTYEENFGQIQVRLEKELSVKSRQVDKLNEELIVKMTNFEDQAAPNRRILADLEEENLGLRRKLDLLDRELRAKKTENEQLKLNSLEASRSLGIERVKR